jgi:hypothetical protein
MKRCVGEIVGVIEPLTDFLFRLGDQRDSRIDGSTLSYTARRTLSAQFAFACDPE